MIGLFFVPIVLMAQTASASPSSALEFDGRIAVFGETYQGTTVEHRFIVRNRGSRPVRILEVRPAWKTGSAEARPEVIPPGGMGEVQVRQPVGDRLGEVSYRFAVGSDDPAGPERKLLLRGFVQSAYDPEMPSVDFGLMSRGASIAFELHCREIERLEVREVLEAPSFLKVDFTERAGVAKEGLKVRLTLTSDAPLGFQSGGFRLRTNVPHQPEVLVDYRANVFDQVAPEENPVDLGLLRHGQSFEKEVVLRSRSGTAFQVQRIHTAAPDVEAVTLPCPEEPVSPACRVLRVRGTAPRSEVVDIPVSVVLSDGPVVPMLFRGIGVSPSAQIHDLGIIGASESEPAGRPDPADSLGNPAPEPAGPPIRPDEARLTWQAAHEGGVYGYLVYRAAIREGPFRRVNAGIVRAKAGGEPHTYHYVDQGLKPGRTYYYHLDVIATTGLKSRLSGVTSKVVPHERP